MLSVYPDAGVNPITLRSGLEPKRKQESDTPPTVPPGCHPGAPRNGLLLLIQNVLLKENIKKVEEVNENLNDTLRRARAHLQIEREKKVKNQGVVRAGC